MTGPFGTRREASHLPAVQEIYRAFRADPGVGRMAPHSRRMLDEACAAARVGLGAFDRRVLAWLSEWEPETAAVIAGLISRANTAVAAPTPEARMVGEVRAVLAAFDWEHDDRQYALEAIERIVRAGPGPAPAEGPAVSADAGTVTLTAEQLATVLDALADAADYRRACADQCCTDCEVFVGATGQACGQHLGDLGAAQAYDELTARLDEARGRRR